MSTTIVTADSTATQDWVRRGKAIQFPLLIVAIIVTTAYLFSLAAPDQSTVRFAPNNAGSPGGRALAQVLGSRGVDVQYEDVFTKALRATGPADTLLIANDPGLTLERATQLIESGANIVAANPRSELVAAISEATGANLTQTGSPLDDSPVAAECSLPAAVAAGTITSNGAGFTAPEGEAATTLCFPAAIGHHLVQVTGPNGQTFTLIDSTDQWTNAKITAEGNAALAIHLLGGAGDLVWYIPEIEPIPDLDSGAVSPPGLVMMIGALALAAVVAAMLSFGRRLGPVVSEDLPVVVKASESTLGRARLYRSAGARGRAAAALRAGSAARISRRLGLPTSATPEAFTSAAARATGRSELQLHTLFYGPPPADDGELTALALQVQKLESEISV